VGYDEKEALDGYTRYMREIGDSSDEVSTTPYHSKVYTESPATRSPVLTVVLTIVILAVLTALALAVLRLVQRRSAALRHETQLVWLRTDEPRSASRESRWDSDISGKLAGDSGLSLNNWKTDYEQFVQ
jgi:hypothetical protein